MKQRRDTKANWAAQNPVLLAGELGIVSDDPNLYKVGDGTTAWNYLPFRGFDGTLVHTTGDSETAAMSQKGVTGELAKLSEDIASAAATDLNLLVVEGEAYDQLGAIVRNSGYNRLQLIQITSNKVYIIGIADSPNITCRLYDKDMNLLGSSNLFVGNDVPNDYKEFPEETRYLGVYYRRDLVTLPKGCGIISCGSSLISLVEGIQDNKEEIIKSRQVAGNLAYEKEIKSGSWVVLDELLSIREGQKVYMRIGASNISRVILGTNTNRIFDSSNTSYDGNLSEGFSFNAKSSIEGVHIYIVCDNLTEQTEIEIKTNLALELLDQQNQIEGLGNAVENNTTRIEELAKGNEVLSMIQVLYSPNLFNRNDVDVIYGAYVKPDGLVTENSAYNASGYIPVEPLTTYYGSDEGDNSPSFRFTCYYDKDKNVISGGLSVLSNSFTTPEECYYVRVSVYSANNFWRYAQVAKDFIPYISYDVSLGLPPSIITDKQRIATLGDVNNVLYGKKWAVVGDSFTAEFSGNSPADWFIEDGIYAGKSKVYGYIIGNRNNMTLQWLGAGGKTMATPADGSFTKTFSLSEYKNIDADVDYITIYLGINDSHHAPGSTGDDGEDKSGEIPLGTIDDTTNATFYGAWNVVIPYLLENHPFAHIGIIVSNGCDTSEYRDAEIAIAKKYGIPYIDLNGDERTPFMLRSQNNNIPLAIRQKRTQIQSIDYDGSITGSANQHPNKDAHEFQADFIETWLRSL